MLLTGHQPNYLPYPGFFHKVLRSDLFLIVDTVQFVKRGPFGWIHRNRIRAREEPGWSWLTVPVITHGRYHQPINEARIDNRSPWRRKHWRTLEERYRHSPGFAEVGPVLSAVYAREWDSLAELNETLIRELLSLLGIRTPVRRLSDLKARGRASELIVNFCRELGADEYLSGVHGRDYLDEPLFAEAGIRLTYQEYRSPEYSQPSSGPFVPNLSVVDLLFSAGEDSRSVLESGAAVTVAPASAEDPALAAGA
jgi:WbqC-like protein family